MENIREYLPFIIPLIAVQLALLGWALHHILTHRTYKRGTRGLWLAVVLVGMEFVGPVLYYLLGREDA